MCVIDSGVSASTLSLFKHPVTSIDFTRDNSTEDMINHGTATLSVLDCAILEFRFWEAQSHSVRGFFLILPLSC